MQAIKTKKSRLVEALLSGKEMTASQIGARFNIKNPTATISSIRFDGVPVRTEQRINGKGEAKTYYSVSRSGRK